MVLKMRPHPQEKRTFYIKLNKSKSTINKLKMKEYLLNVVWTLQTSFWSNMFSPAVWDLPDSEHQVVVCATENYWTSCQVEVATKVYLWLWNEYILII